jgi:hypothetical protein
MLMRVLMLNLLRFLGEKKYHKQKLLLSIELQIIFGDFLVLLLEHLRFGTVTTSMILFASVMGFMVLPL